MFYAFLRNHAMGNVLDLVGIPPEDNHFHAIMMRQMHMKGTDHKFPVIMLYLVQAISDLADMVIIDQGHRCNNPHIITDPHAPFIEAIAHEVPYRLRAVVIPHLLISAVEFFEERAIHGYRKTLNQGHRVFPLAQDHEIEQEHMPGRIRSKQKIHINS